MTDLAKITLPNGDVATLDVDGVWHCQADQILESMLNASLSIESYRISDGVFEYHCQENAREQAIELGASIELLPIEEEDLDGVIT